MRIRDMMGTLQMRRGQATPAQLWTVWGEAVRTAAKEKDFVPLDDYPRPQMVRSSFKNLNGWWEYGIVSERYWYRADTASQWQAQGAILVPFSPESQLSGVQRQLLPGQVLWYRRQIILDKKEPGRLLLHFGAVDQACRVLVNGREAGRHLGGYLPFTLDVTETIHSGSNLLVVLCQDESDMGYHARGKQKLKPGGMFYTAQSGIWQTVWMEWVPELYMDRLDIRPDYDKKMLLVRAHMTGAGDGADPPAVLKLLDNGKIVARAEGRWHRDRVSFRIHMPDWKEWQPEDPFLYDLDIHVGSDRVKSYTAMRCFSLEQDEAGVKRFCVNHRPVFLNGVLDQGYWPDGLYTAPSDEALAADVENMKRMGFNMLRKHCKLEPLRWYYHCDRLGMLVWQDMVNGGGYYDMKRICQLPNLFPVLQGRQGYAPGPSGRKDREGCREWLRECGQTIRHLSAVPSLAGWVIFNEGWGQFATERVTEWVKKMDEQRPVDAASGWFDFGVGDFKSEHNYFRKLKVPRDSKGRAAVLSEYGGLTMKVPGHVYSSRNYGYGRIRDGHELKAGFDKLQARLLQLEKLGLAGAVYTQVSDIEEEENGIYTYDRRICKLAQSEK